MTNLKTTPLNAWHKAHGGRMVEFLGWEMPVQYQGILAEHQAARNQAGLFDVSHMGELLLTGPDALDNLQRLLPNDLAKLQVGQVQYSPMLKPDGTVVDDLSCYRLGHEEYMLCVNAGNKDKDYAWIKSQLKGNFTFEDQSPQTGQIAIQGPLAEKILSKVVNTNLDRISYWWFHKTQWQGMELLIARMGYTGETGFEVFLPWDKTQQLWEALLEAGQPEGLVPCGLGCRDTLRLEVCFPLYGHELNETHNVLGANLGRFLKLEKPHDFIGKQALHTAKQKGDYARLVYLVLQEKGVPRDHFKVFSQDGTEVGEVTSGSHSPSLGQGIAIAYVDAQHAQDEVLLIEIRNKKIPAKRIKPPFWQIRK